MAYGTLDTRRLDNYTAMINRFAQGDIQTRQTGLALEKQQAFENERRQILGTYMRAISPKTQVAEEPALGLGVSGPTLPGQPQMKRFAYQVQPTEEERRGAFTGAYTGLLGMPEGAGERTAAGLARGYQLERESQPKDKFQFYLRSAGGDSDKARQMMIDDEMRIRTAGRSNLDRKIGERYTGGEKYYDLIGPGGNVKHVKGGPAEKTSGTDRGSITPAQHRAIVQKAGVLTQKTKLLGDQMKEIDSGVYDSSLGLAPQDLDYKKNKAEIDKRREVLKSKLQGQIDEINQQLGTLNKQVGGTYRPPNYRDNNPEDTAAEDNQPAIDDSAAAESEPDKSGAGTSDDRRTRAQTYLEEQGYDPEGVDVFLQNNPDWE